MQEEGDGVDYGLATSAARFGGAMALAPTPARKPALVLLVLTAIREPTMLPTTRMVVTALIAEEVEGFSASMSPGDSAGASWGQVSDACHSMAPSRREGDHKWE